MSILEEPQYKRYSRRVAHLLSKQFKALLSIGEIRDRATRETALKIWHDKFKELVEDLPLLVETHTRCVETAKFRQVLKGVI